MQRYFIDKLNLEQKTAFLEKNDFHHIKNVMRHKVNDQIIICNKDGLCFLSSIDRFDDKIVYVSLLEEKLSNDLNVKVDIAQAIIRRERFEYMIQKSTELGVNKIIPTLMKNVIVKLEDKKLKNKLERWNTLAKEASEQSHRNQLAVVDTVRQLRTIDFSLYDLVIVGYEKENQSDTLKKVLKENYQNILVVIGPEGGFTAKEIEFLDNLENSAIVGFGKRILRSETASSYILSVLSYVYEMSE